MKRILFTLYRDRCHSLYKQFISDPPQGYKYFTLDDFLDEFIFEKPSNTIFGIMSKIKRNQKIIRIAKRNKIDIIYSCDGILLFNSPVPWVMECENAISLISNIYSLWKIGRKIIPTILRQKSLKYIIPWTEAAKSNLEHNFKLDKKIKNKIIPIHLCLKEISDYESIEASKTKHKFSILFVTSINYNGENEFYAKGGRILIRVFEKLKKRFDLKLILRSKIPAEFRYIEKDPSIEIYQEPLSHEEFKKLFMKTDLFFFPGYQSPGMAFLDAMNYNLPIVTSNIFANPEMVKTEWNGFLTNFPESANVFYLSNDFDIKGVPSGVMAKEDVVSEEMVEDFTGKISKLQEDRELLKKMGANSKKLLIEEFSLHKRKKELKNIFDKIINKKYEK